MTDEGGVDFSVPGGETNFGLIQPLKEPLTTTFGEMTHERQYPYGCTLDFAIDTRQEMIRITLREGELEKTIDIGKTPADFDPSKARMITQAAGDRGEYLMVIQTPGERPSIRYLDRVDIDHARIVKGSPIILNLNPGRGNRKLERPGVVETINGYKIY